jgi:hypothetical protein
MHWNVRSAMPDKYWPETTIREILEAYQEARENDLYVCEGGEEN